MNPKLIEEMSWRMAEVYGAVTDRLLINLARHFKFIAEGATPSGSFDYMVKKLAEMGQVTRESEAIILQSLGGADEALQGVLEAAIRDGLKGVDKQLKTAAEKGLLLGEGFLPPELSINQMQAFTAYYRQSADKLNLVNTVMLESTQQAYQATVSDIVNKINVTQGILNTETGEVITGVTSFNKAVRDGVQKMVENGLTGFIDHGGHHWSPEAYVAMDIRTTAANASRAAVWEDMERYGDDLYIVSWHNGARPLCYPWQGKVISRSGWTGEVEDLDGNKVHVYAQHETSYGEAAGLFGINCGHYPSPFIPGFSTVNEPQQNEEQNNKEYEESQQQRALERKLRYEKRDLEVLKAQGASDEEIKMQRARVKNARTELDDFCEETGRARRSSRERTPINAEFPEEASFMSRVKKTEWPSGDGGITEEKLDALSKYASDKGIMLDTQSFKRFEGSEETVKQVIDSISDVSKDFPLLADPEKGVILKNAYNMADTDYAKTEGRRITINNNAFRNRAALEADYAEGVKDGIFTDGTTYRNIGHHEAGHAMVNIYKAKYNDIVHGIEPGSLSRTDKQNKSERIAEGICAHYAGTGNPIAETIFSRALLVRSRK